MPKVGSGRESKGISGGERAHSKRHAPSSPETVKREKEGHGYIKKKRKKKGDSGNNLVFSWSELILKTETVRLSQCEAKTTQDLVTSR